MEDIQTVRSTKDIRHVYLKELYGRGKNDQLKIWTISVREGDNGVGYVIIGHKTGEDGQLTEHLEVVRQGKNIGKANETSPVEQALLQAASRVKVQLDRGYKEEIPENGDRSNALGYPMPMLATPLEKVNGELETPFYIQPKMDGFRCLAFKDDEGEVHLYTRRGKRVETLPHLEEIYKEILYPGEHVDGELYLHGQPLQRIASLVKKKQEGSEQIQHHLYDLVTDSGYEDRARCLAKMLIERGDSSLVFVETVKCLSMEQAEDAFQRFRSEGYEGAIIRTLGTPYEIGARSKSLIKMKGFEEEDFEIVDVVLGKPKLKNGREYKVPILICLTPEKYEFRVTAPGNEKEKHDLWSVKGSIIGRRVEVRFSNKVKKTGIPFHPIAVKIKDEELE